jgi:hypothetical protein
MIGWIALGILIASVLGFGAFFLWRWKKPAILNTQYFQDSWRELQKLLRKKDQWSSAIVDADKLLELALKKKRIRGRSMGERLVKAQRLFTDNDGVWFGHKLRNKIDAEPDLKLKENDVKQALIGIRQALKDLGALPQ